MQVLAEGLFTLFLPDVWHVSGLAVNMMLAGQLTEVHGLIIEICSGLICVNKISDGSSMW
jgi:hypothetical protein